MRPLNFTEVGARSASPKSFVSRGIPYGWVVSRVGAAHPNRGSPGGVAEFVAACRAEEVAEGRGLPVEVGGLRLAIFNDGGTFHALLGRCPHANGPMGRGWIEDGEAICPLHRWRFRLQDGRCTTVRGQALHRFPCEVRDGVVWVAV
ncbi:MAG: Rieske (2Fe-2S) protein [Isosphaeraceae bacterium]|nr:Rieske (2Fe-2S) protein [Isosphaeraceae bacterium]